MAALTVRVLASVRTRLSPSVLFAALACVGVTFVAIGCWKAWPPLGYLFTGAALLACAIAGAYLQGGRGA